MGALRLSICDEGVWIARLAFKDPGGGGRTMVQYGTRNLWDPDYPVFEFSQHIGGAVMDVVEWTVS